MSGLGKYLWAALAVAVLAHFAVIHFMPRMPMRVAIDRVSNGQFNTWRVSDRVTETSRTIVRPSPDFAYAACPYDLSRGPVIIAAAPYDAYWSLSFYAENSDNYFVIDDREARFGAEVTLVRRGSAHPEGASMVVESPSARGIALIRRLAPTLDAYNGAVRTARADVCASASSLQPTS